ncbi:MAG: L-tyrosine/L-tryptophan isonitrile synthase family protein [Planctomycetaceae bacterium]
MPNSAAAERLFEIASLLFRERGYPNVTLNDIALAAGCAADELFRHFPRKEGFVLRLYEALANELEAEVGCLPAGTMQTRFHTILRAKLALAQPHRARLIEMIRQLGLTSIEVFDLDDIRPGADFAATRQWLTEQYAESRELLEERTRQFEPHRQLFNGIQVIRRSNAWSRLISNYFPDALRLSIHPQAAHSEKIGIHSRVRELALGDRLLYCGYVGWRGVADIRAPDLPTGQSIWTYGRGSQFGLIPIGGGRVFWFGTATPTLGQGACLAIESAYVLAARLRGGESALRSYERERQTRTARIIRQSWNMGGAIQWHHPLACWLRNQAVHWMPLRWHLHSLEKIITPGCVDLS